MSLDIKKIKKVHFIGIKGVAMATLAIIAKEKGIVVTGSDIEEKFPTDQSLKRAGIDLYSGFGREHIPPDADLIIYTGAFGREKNPETKAAFEKGLNVIPHAIALALFTEGKKVLAVAGSHGKTTTSAMLAHCLVKLGQDPSFAIGCGEIPSLGFAGHFGKGEYFVVEADEYVTEPGIDQTPRFHHLHPFAAIVTNVDYDHPDVYPSLEVIKKSYVAFIQQVKELLVYNGDDMYSDVLPQSMKGKSVSVVQQLLGNYILQLKGTGFDTTGMIEDQTGMPLTSYQLEIPGFHNYFNAAQVYALLHQLGFKATDIAVSFKGFIGTKRRFEKIAEKNGKLLYDDYAHHPAEIASSLEAARKWFPGRRIVAIFQPHTYSRTKALLPQFAQSFKNAHKLILTEIYASARESVNPKINGQRMYEETKKFHSDLYFAPNRSDMLQYLKTNTQPNDLILTMGAGDIYTWLAEIETIL